ncbi:helix-turn-helix domain-containing protein [Paracoccus denitrificans]|jgi:transcriptional regulator with XRE-family HTH domain|uniref:Helix-turn-helix domain protein n=1 Tax=Paracoccus denitrificans (strain Pd 1222) TaxID=318586 RepID=A1B8Q9_PARDP|nr:helix-turn-helix transcriptional regulator [Paracoccus denitrificans]ABL71903.1 helix-turn-helix domain protein [Paracoccus denitrificans PD1222]MBB4627983.1 transcriptional regulator with XRE-family HTH domain [Paracoccus denitrificans]MCU7429052.1 helix-turn-helix domain-containing protein [Paracoccus denitrificans]QAR28490.1 XRE family transcriptional regulator [Paracoccus denitrificans]UPV96633.1 helix-turn-helix domain-containing protein [Paracoccus denitrificans]
MGRTLRSPGHLALMAALKQARLDAGLTQTELAERLKRPQSFVAKYENGERRIEVVELIEIADAIGADPHDIIQIVRDAEGR